MIEIPLGLRRALETGECVLFLGAGIGHNLRDPSGRTAPTAAILANEIADHFSIDTSPQNKADLAKISSIIEIRIGRPELESFLRSRLSNLRPDDNLLWLFSLRWRAIFTTNYDYSIRYAYDLLSNPKQQPIVITQTSEITKYDPRFQVPIYHLHGTLFGPSQPHIVITENDYSIFREQRKMLFELLKYEFATSTILYIGYSHQDSNWRLVLNELYSEFASSQQPRSYRIAPATDALDLEILTARNIETLECTYDDFYLSASVLLSPEDVDVHRLQQERSKIPSDFISEFDRNPASVTRLFSSWTYVNQAPFNEVSNIYDFIRGDKPNWGLVGARHIFERDIESQIYDEVIDNITNQDNKVYINLILAPACYGITTLLMTVASRLVKDRVGAVFFLNSEQSILEGDVEYINSLFSENIILFVDNAAEQGEALNLVVSRLQNSGKRAVFILGERLNEWRQARTRIYGKEFTLDPLSDAEIDRLLDYLSNQGELNTLTPLSRDLQHSIIKQKHGKELVVVMRETTEGKSFDAILENEFRGIKDPLSRKLYLFVCCFYQHGAYIRDSLLSRLLGVSNTELYDLTDEATEGVVIYDCIDKARDTFGARARHRVIAAVVWERCGDASEKEQILQGALNNLNLNYQSDKDAFDRFVRSDRIVDSIRSLEGKTRFFDRASDKDPLSPYVKQHYARMLWRNDRPNLALAQINSAIDLNPRVRVLHHTKGIILAGLAIGSESNEVARRYLVQSEKAFNHCLSMYQKDEYSYQGLAKLYFEWAKRTISEEEQAEYLAKAEEVIGEGLKKVSVREGLWIISSEINEWLGNEPQRIKSLEKAVQDYPNSVVARYILGRAYRKQGELSKSLAVLDPVIKTHFDEFRIFVEYATTLVYSGRPYKEAIAILWQSSLYGLSDPRYIATLGGMLFMDEQFTEAEKVFREIERRNFTADELKAIQFVARDPIDPQQALRIRGRIVAIKTGYCFIDSPPYPRFFCPAQFYNRIQVRSGLEIGFEPAFTAKGPIAYHLRLVP